MDFRAVLIFVCLFTAQAVCGPVNRDSLNTIKSVRKDIHEALVHLDHPGLLPNFSCSEWNFSELVRPEQQHLTPQQLSSFGCHIAEVSKFIPEVSKMLQTSCQMIQDAERHWTGRTVSKNCSLPSFEQDLDGYKYAKCLLQHVNELLSKAKF